MHLARWLGTALFAAIAASCFGSGSGAGAWLHVPGGEFVEGEMPEDEGGPGVAQLKVSTNTLIPGQRNKPLEGALEASATGVAIGLRGDIGYWILPAGLPSVIEPDLPSFTTSLEVSPDLPVRQHQLWVRASDEDGRFGPAATAMLDTVVTSIEGARLVFSLSWDTHSDLDLHVIDPSGVEIYKRDINSYVPPKPGEPPDPVGASDAGGVLDFDSNAECVIDGHCQENVVWRAEPPRGRYVVRVDTFSLCGENGASWVVQAVLDGAVLGEARGTSVPADELQPHDRGAGVTALVIDVL
ncbi:MAG: hypothetical protein HOV80_35855 [Polyangiaceae bacterium]|nr:hypothetical protein [Polyangiaceae bacterium]